MLFDRYIVIAYRQDNTVYESAGFDDGNAAVLLALIWISQGYRVDIVDTTDIQYIELSNG